MPLLGTLHRSDAVATPSRHLGLVPVAERAPDALATVDALADLITENLDLDQDRADRGECGSGQTSATWSPEDAIAELGGPTTGQRPVVAVAGGAAFTFSYAEHAELLAAAGAEVVTFDPLRDGGFRSARRRWSSAAGFPEVYASALAENKSLIDDVRGFAQPAA